MPLAWLHKLFDCESSTAVLDNYKGAADGTDGYRPSSPRLGVRGVRYRFSKTIGRAMTSISVNAWRGSTVPITLRYCHFLATLDIDALLDRLSSHTVQVLRDLDTFLI